MCASDNEVVPMAAEQLLFTCVFCRDATPRLFNPMTLLEISKMNQTVPETNTSDQDDDMSEYDSRFMELSVNTDNDAFRFSHSLICCSAPCWVAHSLMLNGEKSHVGRTLLGNWPHLNPRVVGGRVYEIYVARSAETAHRMAEAARIYMMQRH